MRSILINWYIWDEKIASKIRWKTDYLKTKITRRNHSLHKTLAGIWRFDGRSSYGLKIPCLSSATYKQIYENRWNFKPLFIVVDFTRRKNSNLRGYYYTMCWPLATERKYIFAFLWDELSLIRFRTFLRLFQKFRFLHHKILCILFV